MKTRVDQAEKRRTLIARDQHGRDWDVTIDSEPKAQFAFCTPPLPRFSAPLYPPTAYLKPAPGRVGDLVIDYDGWLSELQFATALYTRHLRAFAAERYQGSMVSEALKNPPPDLLACVGDAPPPLDFVKAARVGNPWVLGLRKRNGDLYPVPRWAQPLLDQLARHQAPTREDSIEADRARYLDEMGDEADDNGDDAALAGAADPAWAADRERYLDLDEAYDPEASGGTRVAAPTRRKRRGTDQST